MTTGTDLVAEDRAYYAVVASQARRDMIRAHAYAQCLAEQIEPLAQVAELPAQLQNAYAEMHADLVAVARVVDRMARKYSDSRVTADLGLLKHDPEPTNELVNALMAGIRLLDDVEGRIRDSIDELRNRLKEPHSSTSEWEDVSIEAIVTLYLDPSPERKIYSTLLEPVYFRAQDSFEEFLDGEPFITRLLGDGNNWNHRFQPGHPMGSIRYGYLVYSFIEESHLPWLMLAHIREVEVIWRIRGERRHTRGD